MRLIDANKLLLLINEQKEKETGMYTKGLNAGLNIVKSIVNDKTQTPTAYDVGKVVRQLMDEKHMVSLSDEELGIRILALDDAIEIVEAGGIEYE